ncbi:GntP family gluconate:H+ symporter/Gnt-I system low-affinity gluconate transporter [Natranaerovirga hydrolytica]|uniref:GntP family gluconate:H+ symporter/Gnt-I system low-affinity gluconate transporter n=1 Tax=Natranaerovirga hydrolytica TaxID=680378 RepID=A0A4R1MJX6_9FIRM|nr:gluconate:H+ symporter [Natranaerovirga hydrolytica]TCK92765.1 GntP family gluconate:H+ symporter/Gnt-I system low-affinity gluconate transporter [Natranaerovirga hydrolytica]
MNEAFTTSPERLIISALMGLAVLLFLIIKGKMQPVIAIIMSAIVIGIGVGMPLPTIVDTISRGVGDTLQSIALLVGLGSMFGAILEISGGAQSIAVKMVDKFGNNKAAWALGIAGLVISMPVYFDAGLIILIPLAFSLANKTKKSTLTYAIPLLAGLAVGHAFIPPTPGPVLIATMLGVDLGIVVIVGLVIGAFSMVVAGPIFGKFIGDKIYVPVPKSIEEMDDFDESKLPKFRTVVSIILIPLVLILLNTASDVIPALSSAKPLFEFIGTPFIALTIAILVAMYLLGTKNGYTREELEKIMTKALEPTGLILLVTAGGGILRYMLEDSGLGVVIGDLVSVSSLPLVLVAFLVAGLVRISIGSATVSMIMAAGIMASMPEIAGLSQLHLAAILCAISGGATIMSHVNDSGFWLVTSLLKTDVKTTFKSWTVMETIVGFCGLIGALVLSIFA